MAAETPGSVREVREHVNDGEQGVEHRFVSFAANTPRGPGASRETVVARVAAISACQGFWMV
jgi:hypothetical protein